MKKIFKRFGTIVTAIGLTVAAASSQSVDHTNYSIDKTVKSDARINPTTLAMELSIPLPSYPGRAGNSIPNSINYSSKIWSAGTPSHYSGFLGPRIDIQPTFAQYSTAGWVATAGVPLIDDKIEGHLQSGEDWAYDVELAQQDDYEVFYVKRIRLRMPDGTTHEMRADDGEHSYGTAYTPTVSDSDRRSGIFLSVDGSGMRLEWTYSGSAWHNVLYMPDGGRYIDVPALSGAVVSSTVLYFDRSGNEMSFNRSTGSWTDTMGRSTVNPLPSSTPSSGTQTFHYPTMSGGANQDIQLVWANLDTEQSSLSYSSQVYCSGASGTTIPSGSTNLFTSYATYGVRVCGTSSVFDPVVLTQVILPNGAKYIFHYNIYAEIEKIDYPTGGYERFVYDYVPSIGSAGHDSYDQFNRGITDRYVSPDGTSGSEVHWQYAVQKETTLWSLGPYHVKTYAPDGSWSEQLLKDQWSNATTHYGFGDPFVGIPYETRVYDNTTNNHLMRRTLSSSAYTGPLTIGGVSGVTQAYRDVRPDRQVSMIFESGNTNALVSMSETVYDTSGSTDPAYFSSLNAIQSKAYNYVVVSASTAASANISTAAGWFSSSDIATISEADYLYDSNYKARDLTGLVTEKRIEDGSGNPKAKTQFSYDESSYITSTSGSMPPAASGSWLDPTGTGTYQLGPTIGAKRGFPTTVKGYYDLTNSYYIDTHTFFDQYGNATKARDGRGNDTTTDYDAAYAFAYPTSVTTAAPDSGGTYGSTSGFTTTSVYDYNTGLPTSTVDANGQTTTVSYIDPSTSALDLLLRVRKVTAPNGQQTITEYGTPSSGQYPSDQRFMHVKIQIDDSQWKEAYTWADGFGRTIKSQTIDSNGDIFTETEYDDMGRTKRSTNPYRSGDTKQWTTPTYDELGRTVMITSPDSSTVQTAFGLSTSSPIGTTKLVTDQAGKQRKGVTNALGHIVRVIEDPTTQNLATDYLFDTLGNLRETTQGSQYRYFMHDALGRMLYAKQPEQDTNTNFSATDPITGNTAWSEKYTYDSDNNIATTTDGKNKSITATYDALNRLTLRNYSDSGTPDVTFYYDGKGLGSVPSYSKGKTTKVASSVSETRNTTFDSMGRLLTSEQRTTPGQLAGTEDPYSFIYTYNLSGALIEETYPSGRVVKNTLDADGQLFQVQSRKDSSHGYWAYAKSFAYDSSGEVTKMQLGNGRWETASYNNRLQVTQIGLGTIDSTQDLLKLQYKYTTPSSTDNNGSLREQDITVPAVGSNPTFTAVQSYVYDDLNRLLSATETVSSTQTWKQTFSYDRYGNRTYDTSSSHTTTLGSCATAVCNPSISTSTNRITSSGYTFDENGAVTQDAEGQRFGYDQESRQKEFFNASNSGSTPDATYDYDGNGNRVKKNTSTETTIFVYDASSQLAAEYSTALASTPQVSYLTNDAVGSARIITDESGAVTSRKDYTAFGDEVVSSQRVGGSTGNGYDPPNIRHDYTGYQKDEESGLEYSHARFYNSMQGRFTSVDPLTASASIANPQTLNRYSYSLNSPYKFTDPLGLAAKAKDSKLELHRWSVFWSEVYGAEGDYDKQGSVISHTAPTVQQQQAKGPIPPSTAAVDDEYRYAKVIISIGSGESVEEEVKSLDQDGNEVVKKISSWKYSILFELVAVDGRQTPEYNYQFFVKSPFGKTFIPDGDVNETPTFSIAGDANPDETSFGSTWTISGSTRETNFTIEFHVEAIGINPFVTRVSPTLVPVELIKRVDPNPVPISSGPLARAGCSRP